MESSWRQLLTGDGCPTLLHPVHGEPCHETRGAWAEATELHVFGCDLPRRLLRGERLRLLDVGSAPGWNLAAAFLMADHLPGSLEVTAVERSEGALSAGLKLSRDRSWWPGAPSGAGSALQGAHAGLRAAREGLRGDWITMDGGTRLRLYMGCVRELLVNMDSEERFDAVFLDCFSPGVEPEAWDPDFLFELGRRVAVRGRLSTYTISHPVRAALMASGLAVGWPGARSGRRGGTWASRGGWVPPLSERLQARLERHRERLMRVHTWAQTAGDLE